VRPAWQLLDVKLLLNFHEIAWINLTRRGVGHSADESMMKVGPDVVSLEIGIHAWER
jgi:hypothetical protein